MVALYTYSDVQSEILFSTIIPGERKKRLKKPVEMVACSSYFRKNAFDKVRKAQWLYYIKLYKN